MMMFRVPSALALALIALGAVAAPAQTAPEPLPAEEAFALTVEREGDGLSLTWDIAEGYYLYRDHLRAESAEGEALPLETPPGETRDDPTFGRMDVYHDAVTARIGAAGGPVTLIWQGCMEDSICYPPQSRIIDAGSAGGDGAGSDPSAGSGNFARSSGGTDHAAAPSGGSGSVTLSGGPGLLDGLSERGGTALVVAGFLGFGLLLAFTPCVFPMVPIVAGMVMGGGTRVSARRGLALSSAYVLAMASAFALLGVVAAWSGQNLQIALQSPVAIGTAAAIFVLLAASMFGLFELQMPRALQERLGRVQGRRGSLGGAALLGLTSALIVGPCVTAPLAGALLYIAQTGDVVLGALALFALGLGQGLPLLAVGTFGPKVLPRSGPWMERTKQLFGLVFLGMAVWLLSRVIPAPATLALWSILLIAAGTAIAAERGRLARAAGAVLIFTGALQGIGAGLGAPDPLRPLGPLVAASAGGDTPDSKAAFSSARTRPGLEQALANAEGPALVYVTAEWCTTCRSIERGPLSDANVLDAMTDLAPISVDVTEFGPESQEVLDMLGAAGPPTMVFLDAGGREAPGSRIVGDTEAAAMLRSIGKVTP